ncbi:hypothetical protein Tco_0706528 [Tanacetum coccineum]|uniref:Beta-lactamase-related domain-containing protein n=1 Tax=Tanacetum coccineum TaxID=301880 RepID=A0ABQ4Y989_9ASTR
MLAYIISWFLVCEVSELLKNVMEHDAHFIAHFMDEHLRNGDGLAHLGGKSSRVFKYGYSEVGGVVNNSSQGARVVGAFGYRESKEWLLVTSSNFRGGFLVEDEALEALVILKGL